MCSHPDLLFLQVLEVAGDFIEISDSPNSVLGSFHQEIGNGIEVYTLFFPKFGNDCLSIVPIIGIGISRALSSGKFSLAFAFCKVRVVIAVGITRNPVKVILT